MNRATSLDWIEEINRQDQEENAKAALKRLAQPQATAVVKRDGPQFFRNFIAALELNAEGIKDIGLLGRVEKIREDQTEWQWRITVERRSAIPRSTWVNVFYALGGQSITLHTPDLNTIFGRSTELTLCDPCGNAGCVSDDLPPGSSALAAAKLVAKRMVAAIRA